VQEALSDLVAEEVSQQNETITRSMLPKIANGITNAVISSEYRTTSP